MLIEPVFKWLHFWLLLPHNSHYFPLFSTLLHALMGRSTHPNHSQISPNAPDIRKPGGSFLHELKKNGTCWRPRAVGTVRKILPVGFDGFSLWCIFIYIYIFVCWRIFCEFTVYLNINHRIDIRHCMLHLHTHATLYSVCRLVVPCGNEKLWVSSLADVPFLLSQCVERNECIFNWAKRYFLENSQLELQTDENWEFE